MQFFVGTNIDFVRIRKYGYILSISLLVIGIIFYIMRGGLNYGVDFRGGVSIRVQFTKKVNIGDVRNSLGKIGYAGTELKQSVLNQGGKSVEEYIIRFQAETESVNAGERVLTQLSKDFGADNVVLRSVETVGPKIGGELRKAAIYASLLSLLLVMVYIAWRFEFRFAVGAIIPLFHDVLVIIGLFAFLNIEITLVIVAAVLTIIGYDINDTIVVYDRIRENLKNLRRENYFTIVNKSINETLSRTIITGLSTLFVLIILFFFGGDVIHDFAFVLFFGIVIGTYSSIFVAAPLLIEWERWQLRHGKTSIREKKS